MEYPPPKLLCLVDRSFFFFVTRCSGKTKRQEGTTTVEIQIPHQEELCIISDTEILGDLGLGTVSLNDLKTMLPKDLLGNARYVTNPGNVTVHGGFERVVCSH